MTGGSLATVYQNFANSPEVQFHWYNNSDLGVAGEHLDLLREIPDRPEETSPLLEGVVILIIPEILRWIGLIELALKLWAKL